MFGPSWQHIPNEVAHALKLNTNHSGQQSMDVVVTRFTIEQPKLDDAVPRNAAGLQWNVWAVEVPGVDWIMWVGVAHSGDGTDAIISFAHFAPRNTR